MTFIIVLTEQNKKFGNQQSSIQRYKFNFSVCPLFRCLIRLRARSLLSFPWSQILPLVCSLFQFCPGPWQVNIWRILPWENWEQQQQQARWQGAVSCLFKSTCLLRSNSRQRSPAVNSVREHGVSQTFTQIVISDQKRGFAQGMSLQRWMVLGN